MTLYRLYSIYELNQNFRHLIEENFTYTADLAETPFTSCSLKPSFSKNKLQHQRSEFTYLFFTNI